MTNLKDYRNKELRYYLIANIAVLLLLLDFSQIPQLGNNVQTTVLLFHFIRITILSSTIFALTFVADSFFSSKLKELLIIGHSPGEKIFTKIKKVNFDKRFSSEDVLKAYSDIYETLPNKKKDKYAYENTEWNKIYNKHREITMIKVSHRDFLLCRDMYFSTITVIIIYLVLTFVFKAIPFDYQYIGYLSVMLIILNIGTRNKAWRFVFNVIAYDIGIQNTNKKNEGE
jgi:hypothetical protein